MNRQSHVLICLSALIMLPTACSLQNDADKAESVNEFLTKTSDQLNEGLPDMVDENTVLETTIGFKNQFTYYYTLLNYSADDVDVDAFVKQMKPALLQNACNTTSLEPLFDKGVTIQYIYSDKDRREFAVITVSPMECE